MIIAATAVPSRKERLLWQRLFVFVLLQMFAALVMVRIRFEPPLVKVAPLRSLLELYVHTKRRQDRKSYERRMLNGEKY